MELSETNNMVRIPYNIKTSLFRLKLHCSTKLSPLSFFVTVIFILGGCNTTTTETTKKVEISVEDRKWMGKFFSDLLFEEQGVFTLFEDKPMVMTLLYYYTKEEMQTFYDALPESVKKETQSAVYDYAENWDKWERTKELFPIEKYLFAKRCISPDRKLFLGCFVNIAETALAIQENYEDFRRVVGTDFHPLQEVLNIGDESSVFWDKVLKNHALQGILLGFGKRNAYLFQWMAEGNSEKEEQFIEQSLLYNISDKNPFYGTATVENFAIPVFRHYASEENNKLLEKYKQQREKIRSIYKGRDCLEVTLHQLTSS